MILTTYPVKIPQTSPNPHKERNCRNCWWRVQGMRRCPRCCFWPGSWHYHNGPWRGCCAQQESSDSSGGCSRSLETFTGGHHLVQCVLSKCQQIILPFNRFQQMWKIIQVILLHVYFHPFEMIQFEEHVCLYWNHYSILCVWFICFLVCNE